MVIVKKEKIKSVVVIVLFLIITLIMTGSLFSGYHLVDDHCLYTIKNMINKNGVINTIIQYTKGDLSIRFRPLYSVEQVVGTYFFRTHLLCWNIYKFFEAIITVSCIYTFARKLQLNLFWSWAFTGIVVCGPQFICWCRSANQENTGLLLCSVALLFLIKCYDYNSKKMYRVLFVIFTILMSLEKESFIIFIPALYLFEVCFCAKNIQSEKCAFVKILFFPIKKHFTSWITLLLVFFSEIYIIIEYVGTNSIGYAGFSSDTSMQEYLNGIILSIKGDLKYAILLFLAGFLLFIYIIIHYHHLINSYCVLQLLLVAYIFFSQLALHAKSSMDSRYLIPWIYSIAVFVAWIIGGNENFYDKDIWWHDYKLIIIIYLSISISICFNVAYRWANEAPTGKNRFLTEVYEYSHEGDSVGVYGFFADEHILSIDIWLMDRNIKTLDITQSDDITMFMPETLLIKGDTSGLRIDKYQYVWVNDNYSVWRRIEL